jgi:hypothetical protein
MNHYFKPTEKDLLPIKAQDLKQGYIFWIKQDNGEFHKAVVDLAWYNTDRVLNAYRAGIKRLSVENKLFTRRDKPGQDFRDLL